MAKKKLAKKKKKATTKGKKTRASKSANRKAAPAKKAARPGRVTVDSISSGSETSTLNPKGKLIVEIEEESSSRVRKGDLSGDLQGLSTSEVSDSESVTELSEEGQALEAELIGGVEDAPDPDQGEVRVHKAPQRRIPDYKNRNRI